MTIKQPKIKYGPKRFSGDGLGGWQRYVTLEDGRVFNVSLTHGRRVRIAYKPRGQNMGYEWWAYCSEVAYVEDSNYPKTVKKYPAASCLKSTGVKPILAYHEII